MSVLRNEPSGVEAVSGEDVVAQGRAARLRLPWLRLRSGLRSGLGPGPAGAPGGGRGVEPLLPLRAFLGATYVFAGFQKLHDRAFLDAHAPQSFAVQTAALRHRSPIGGLLGPAVSHPVLFGTLIALGELAVGLGTLLGLWTRLAAAGGAVLAATFFLTVSWNTDPYYYGSDIVFLFAWLPLVIAGSSPLSVDAWSARRRTVGGAAETVDAEERRALLQKLGVTGIVGVVVLATAGGIRKLAPKASAVPAAAQGLIPTSPAASAGPTSPVGATSPAAPTSPAASDSSAGSAPTPMAGVKVRAVPAQGAVMTTLVDGSPVAVARGANGTFVAFSGICTHAGCAVTPGADGLLDCPCHGSTFDAKTGAVVTGPATQSLPSVPVTLLADGILKLGS